MRLVLSLLVALALVLAGCGSGPAKPFVPDATAACLRQHHFSASTTKGVPLVAQTAANGGLIASPKEGGNTLVIGFAADTADASNLAKAFRRVAPARYRAHIRDVMSSNRNAVLLWTISPSPAQQQTAVGCLQS